MGYAMPPRYLGPKFRTTMKRSVYFFLLGAFLLDSCKKDGSGPDDGGPRADPLVTEVGAPMGDAVSRAIGTGGGTLTSGDGRLSVTIPEGALPGTTTVSIQPIANHTPLGLGMGYRLLPEGVTFARPVKLTFHYDEALLAGTDENFLWVTTQNPDRSWSAMLRSSVDRGTGTVTVETTHFSDWAVGRFVDMTLVPGAGLVKVGHSLALAVTVFQRPEDGDEDDIVPLSPITGDDGDELAPLTPIVSGEERLMSFRVKGWALNGVNAPVSNTYGKLAPGKLSATYTAPEKRPQRPQVAVSAQLEARSGDNRVRMTFMLVSNLTIIESDYFLRVVVDGTEYIYYQYGFNGEVPENPNRYQAANCGMTDGGALSLVGTYYDGGALTNFLGLVFSHPAQGGRAMNCPYNGDHDEDEITFSNDLTTGRGYRDRYTTRWKEKDSCESEGKCAAVRVTLTGFKRGLMEVAAGTFSGTLYEDEPGSAEACRSSTPHTVSGEFRLVQAN